MKQFSRMIGAAALAAGLAGAAAADELSAVTSSDVCPANLSSLSGAVGTVVSCWCPGAGTNGSIWGSGPYTADSDLCGAARHAGAVPGAGGAIWARITAGQSSYSGSTSNGVSTSDYGAYGGSFVIAARTAATTASCPTTMQGQSGTVTCSCSAAATTGGTVWGTDIYTEDSAICRAALHAGAIGADGGTVSIVSVGGQQEYVGSTRNGVSTSDYGAWGASYMFAN